MIFINKKKFTFFNFVLLFLQNRFKNKPFQILLRQIHILTAAIKIYDRGGSQGP